MRTARPRRGPDGLIQSTFSLGWRIPNHARRGRARADGNDRFDAGRSLSASYLPSSDLPSDLPALATTLRRKSY